MGGKATNFILVSIASALIGAVALSLITNGPGWISGQWYNFRIGLLFYAASDTYNFLDDQADRFVDAERSRSYVHVRIEGDDDRENAYMEIEIVTYGIWRSIDPACEELYRLRNEARKYTAVVEQYGLDKEYNYITSRRIRICSDVLEPQYQYTDGNRSGWEDHFADWSDTQGLPVRVRRTFKAFIDLFRHPVGTGR